MKKILAMLTIASFLFSGNAVYGAGTEKEVFLKGVADAQQGNYRVAIKEFSNAIKIKPDFAEAYHNRGLVYYLKGQGRQGARGFQ